MTTVCIFPEKGSRHEIFVMTVDEELYNRLKTKKITKLNYYAVFYDLTINYSKMVYQISFYIYCFMLAQHSIPYNKVGLIAVL